MLKKFEMIEIKANEVMKNPGLLHSYEDIILGTKVKMSCGKYERMWAVSPSTWRAFREIDSPSEIYKSELITKKDYILESLKVARSEYDIDALENYLYDNILYRLTSSNRNSNSTILSSYNRIRKPIDLYIEHIVLMSKELRDYRNKLIPFLFLPLDSWIFDSEIVFTIEELKNKGLKRGSGYGELTKKEDYIYLQEILNRRVKSISDEINKMFYKVYLDLLWNNRFERNGLNLFELKK